MEGQSLNEHIDAINEQIAKIELADDRIFNNLLTVCIGPLRIQALIDSGATVCCISDNVLSKIAPFYVKPQDSNTTTVYGVGNLAHEVTGKQEIKFKLNGIEFTQSFLSLQNLYEMILGMDFHKKHRAKIDFEESKMFLQLFLHPFQ